MLEQHHRECYLRWLDYDNVVFAPVSEKGNHELLFSVCSVQNMGDLRSAIKFIVLCSLSKVVIVYISHSSIPIVVIVVQQSRFQSETAITVSKYRKVINQKSSLSVVIRNGIPETSNQINVDKSQTNITGIMISQASQGNKYHGSSNKQLKIEPESRDYLKPTPYPKSD